MSNEPSDFREKLFSAQDISPTLRAAYRKEVDSMTDPALTPRAAAMGVVLLLILVGCIAGIIRAMFIHHPGALFMTGWVALLIAFVIASVLIVRDLLRWKSSPRSVFSIAWVLTGAAGTITVVALIQGLGHASDPKATFNAFYVFVFYFACAMWSLETRIARAELTAREQMLRLECRLADLAERLGK